MRALKWLGYGLGGLFLLFLLLPGTPPTNPGRRALTGGELETVGMLMGGMLTCGADSGWIADKRIRLRGLDSAMFTAHFEPAYAAGRRLAGSASAATCADMLSNSRATIDRIAGP